MTHPFPQFFNHEQAEAALDSFRSSIPLEVSAHVTDINHYETGEFLYSFIAFGLRGSTGCVCTVDNEQALKDMARFIDLMSGFQYPPRDYARDRAGNPIENEPTAESYMDLSVSSEKMARVFDPEYIPVDDFDDIPF